MSVVRGMDDRAYVAAQYATEDGLAARKAAYRAVSGIDRLPEALDEALVIRRRPAVLVATKDS